MRIVFLFHRLNIHKTVVKFPRILLKTYVHKNRENPWLWAELYITTPLRHTSIADIFIEYQYKKL